MFKSRRFRLLCSLFVLILCFQSFGLGVSAASDNLISSNLTTWTDWSELQDGASDVRVTTKSGIYRVTANPLEGYSTYLGVIFDHSSLIAGHSYSLSFKMPNLSEINTAFNESYTQGILDNHFNRCIVQVGVGFISSSGLLNVTEDLILFKITADNYTNFFGKSLSASFIAPNYSGTPVVYISVSSLNSSDHSFYFSNFKLVDNDDNSAELTGIKGFLHSIRWDLVGGKCTEDDCPHSSSGNPHLSLTERMSSGFASMFQSIGDKFEKGSTLNTWFTNLANKVGNVDSSISDLGDREEGFFSDLGNSIGGFFTDLKTNMSEWFSDIGDWFSDLGDDIGGFFSDLKTNMSAWFSELGNKITTKFQEIGDKFTEFFEKFKPRVSISFKWIKGSFNPNTGEVDLSTTLNACVTEYFDVLDNPYYIEFHKSQGDFVTGFYYKYDLDHNFISYKNIPPDSEPIVLEPGYSYRFRLYRGANVTELYGDNLSNVCNELLVVYAEEGWVNALLYNIKMGIKSLFVPDEQAITDLKLNLDSLMREHLGIIYTCGNLVKDFLEDAFNIIFEAPDSFEVVIPDVSFEAGGTTVPVFTAQNIDFSFMKKPVFQTLYSMYKVALYIFFGGLEVKYALRTYRKVMSN